MTIRLDQSDRTTLIVCSCGHRQLLAYTDTSRAWTVARQHEARSHPGVNQVSNVLATRRRRGQ